MINVSDESCRKKIKTHLLSFFSENRAFITCGKYGTARQATVDNIIVCRKDANYMPEN
jgi:hypothetical protein